MRIACRILGHHWAPMVTVPSDLCLRCDDVRVDEQRQAQRRAQLMRIVDRIAVEDADLLRRLDG